MVLSLVYTIFVQYMGEIKTFATVWIPSLSGTITTIFNYKTVLLKFVNRDLGDGSDSVCDNSLFN